MIDIQPKSNLVEHVIENVSNFQLLNADNIDASERVFIDRLLESLPPTSHLPIRKTEVKGKCSDTHDVNKSSDHHFILKRYYPGLVRGSTFEEKFETLKTEYERAQKYLGEYMPVTVLFNRNSEYGDREMLVAQDIIEGTQLKGIVKDNKKLDKPLTTELKMEIQQILLSCVTMFEETGFLPEFDLIFDFENNRAQVFDFQHQDTSPYSLARTMDKLKKLGIRIPNVLDVEIID